MARTEQRTRALRPMFEGAVEGIFQTTPDGRYITANPALARIYGYESAEALTCGLTDIARQLYVDPETREEFRRRLQRDDEVSGFEAEIYRRDGTTRWISEHARAVRDPYGRLLYYEGTVEDITERKRSERALRSSEIRFRALFDAVPLGIASVDPDGRIISANRSFLEMLGLTGLGLGLTALETLGHPADVSRHRQLFESACLTGESLELRYPRREGGWLRVRATARRIPGGAIGEDQTLVVIERLAVDQD